MKAIIPVAGAGTRLRPHTYTQPKALIPVAGKPIVGFIIDQLQEAGFTEFIFIIGYLGEKIMAYVNEKYPDLDVTFIVQESRKGLGHAIHMAKDYVDPEDEIFIVLGDTIVEIHLEEILQIPHSALGVRKVAHPKKFGVAEIGPDNFIKKVIEKPLIPKSNLALVGLYKIKETSELFKALEHLINNEIRTNDEFHLTDAIEIMIKQGTKFSTFPVINWHDCGKIDILLKTNALLLKKRGNASENVPFYSNTIIIHPVSIAEGTRISNSIIGPNVTIGENSTIQYSVLRDSIIGNFVNLDSVMLNDSVIGSDSSIKGHTQSLNIGDNTEIDLSGTGDSHT